MAEMPDFLGRTQHAKPDDKGLPTFDWQLTHTSILDTVRLIVPPTNTVPIIFVPGIMGSNLRATQGRDAGKAVWRLDGGTLWRTLLNDVPVNLAKRWAFEDAGVRQRVLHPSRVDVDFGGQVPDEAVGTSHGEADYRARYWGEVAETSYHKFMLWLEERMNPSSSNPATWEDFYYVAVSAAPVPGQRRQEPKLPPGIGMRMNGLPLRNDANGLVPTVMSDDLLARAKHRFPVYACGYNWLDSNDVAASRLAKRIDEVIAENNRGQFTCSQVILVTHSMGGLVARACNLLPGMTAKIAGVVHGVMPATGAAVAYRRCKVGMRDEDFAAAIVIGATGREVTAVFAQAPGALQLLPSQSYGQGWLKFNPSGMRVQPAVGRPPNELEEILVVGSLPGGKNPCPYDGIYLRKDRWWGLVREEWLKPKGGIEFKWAEFKTAIGKAKQFHDAISGEYHPNTFVYYGDDGGKQASFDSIHWDIDPGMQPTDGPGAPTAADVISMDPQAIRTDGSNPSYVGGKVEFHTTYMGPMGASTSMYQTSYWQLTCRKQDAKGDGTVPSRSGAAPARGGAVIQQQFALRGFGHEASYKDPVAQVTSLYCVTKIAAKARLA
jgi:pimeloyl-ACP methyl ester carboxylesterase